MRSDREVTLVKPVPLLALLIVFPAQMKAPVFFFASVHFIQSKCSHYPVRVKGSWPMPEHNKGVSQEQPNLQLGKRFSSEH